MAGLELTGDVGGTATRLADGPILGRVMDWPCEPDVAQIVLADHHMHPTPSVVADWVTRALIARPATRAIRTGAMFPEAARAFDSAGFHTIDTLALLEARLDSIGQRVAPGQRWRTSTQRMRTGHLGGAAAIDQRAFGSPWGNDVASLTSISDATPRHRARVINAVHDGDPTDPRPRLAGFAITGLSGAFGYLQRLAVDPTARRQGLARELVDDSMQWMRRRGATTAMVNTALDNQGALALYADAGFRHRPDTLTILELSGPALSGARAGAGLSDLGRTVADSDVEGLPR